MRFRGRRYPCLKSVSKPRMEIEKSKGLSSLLSRPDTKVQAGDPCTKSQLYVVSPKVDLLIFTSLAESHQLIYLAPSGIPMDETLQFGVLRRQHFSIECVAGMRPQTRRKDWNGWLCTCSWLKLMEMSRKLCCLVMSVHGSFRKDTYFQR